MSVKGFIDRKGHQERLKAQMRRDNGEGYEPPGGWDSFFYHDPVCDVKCQMCGKMAPEVRPFGPNHESICEACAEKQPQISEMRWKELNPDG